MKKNWYVWLCSAKVLHALMSTSSYNQLSDQLDPKLCKMPKSYRIAHMKRS